MKFRLRFLAIAMAIGTMGFGFGSGPNGTADLSTPQKSFSLFVDILISGNAAALQKVATPTGQTSLLTIYQEENAEAGMTTLGKQLAAANTKWEEITEDIYFASAKVGDKVHKMEFTKEEPGWMLYHWQIGGGADAHGVDEPTEPED